MSPITSSSDGLSDDAVVAGTGQPWTHWFALLDAAGAAGWPHPQIARWLVAEHGVAPWWAQSVTVGFEQARGLRLPGQRADGRFEVSASKTFALGQQDALDAVVGAVSAALDAPPSAESRDAKYASARWQLAGGEVILARANPTSSGRTSVSLTHQRLDLAEKVAPAKSALAGWLEAASS